MSFGSKLKFHYSNIYFKKTSLTKLLSFYKDLLHGRHTLSSSPDTPACLLSQFLLFNKNIRMKDNPVYLAKYAAKNINFLCQLFEEGKLKLWYDPKLQYKYK